MTATRERIRSAEVTEPAEGMWSNCLRVGNQVFISGLTARGRNLEVVEGSGEYEQAVVVFGKIRSLIEAAGGTMNDIVKILIFVTDIGKNHEVWRARREFFSGDFPASSLVEVSALARPDILVEIEAVGIIGCSS